MHIETPCIRSRALEARTGGEVWLKMESAQPVGSFKIRGIGHACR
ncbi:MAG: pyridoxal-phosphate dependent enzyme, partial [Proteobacteria bacterium]|nr:pyridoxal-phosphate dependent enzyme [Pseudomonadota bacterium]